MVFGGGEVAQRKIKALLESGARVEAASRDYSEPLLKLARRNPRLGLKPKSSLQTLLKNAALVFAATSDPAWNRTIAARCRKKKILVNVADQPELCDFFVPSVVRKGKLEIAISTGGTSPLLARKFREELSRKIRPEAVRLLGRMQQFRRIAFAKISSQKERKNYFEMKLGRDFHFLKGRNGHS